jgi:ribose 5-phosphate isomerase A
LADRANQFVAQVTSQDALKQMAGEAAAQLVTDGMVVGLGTGSTVRYTIEALGKRVQSGLKIRGIPTSQASADLAQKLGIPLTTLDDVAQVDLTIDGADEFDGAFRLIKGGGGALTREKVVARASKRMVVVADASKQVSKLGSTFALPIEVIDLAKGPLLRLMASLGAKATVRQKTDGTMYRTDNGHLIVDARFGGIEHPEELERRIEAMPGVLACGLFLGLCDTVILGSPSGVKTLHKT